jgi:hypothetical protein
MPGRIKRETYMDELVPGFDGTKRRVVDEFVYIEDGEPTAVTGVEVRDWNLIPQGPAGPYEWEEGPGVIANMEQFDKLYEAFTKIYNKRHGGGEV